MSLVDIGYSDNRVFTFNPNPYNLNRRPDNGFGEGLGLYGEKIISPEDKKKTWCFSSLVHNKTRSWLDKRADDLKWPVEHFGSRRGKYKCTRLKESKMVETFMENWGVMASMYYHAGCGWWRPRVLQTADVGSILVCDSKEGAVYSDAHVGLDPVSIENMSIAELADLAKRQREGLYDRHPLDKAVTRRELLSVLEAFKCV
jgi:hypothetical protein